MLMFVTELEERCPEEHFGTALGILPLTHEGNAFLLQEAPTVHPRPQLSSGTAAAPGLSPSLAEWLWGGQGVFLAMSYAPGSSL